MPPTSPSKRQRWRLKSLGIATLFFIIQLVASDDNNYKRPPEFSRPDDAGVQPTQIWIDERERLNLKCPLKTNATFIQWLKG
jgi:hypothetical protein